MDKARAEAGARRISEASLLWLAFLGGTVGGLCRAQSVSAQDAQAALQ
ncbi:MAG: DUF1294 domain-containing protein [Novosphingobium sp.]